MNGIIETYKEIDLNVDSVKLKGNLRLADNSKGIIIFSHGSGSSRLSIRNNYVASLLLDMGFSSLLFDLLTPKEDLIYENRFNINLLSTSSIFRNGMLTMQGLRGHAFQASVPHSQQANRYARWSQ